MKAHPEAVSGAGRRAAGISFPLSENDPNFIWLYPYFLASGGGFSDSMGNVVMDSPENARASRWLQKTARTSPSRGTKGIIEGRMMFATDQIVFWLDGSWIRGLLRDLSGRGKEFDDHYLVTTVPTGPSGRWESILWHHMLGITRQCASPDSAYKLIEYLTSDEETAAYMLETLGMLPPTIDLLHKPPFRTDLLVVAAIRQMDTVSRLPLDHALFDRTEPIISQCVAQTIMDGCDVEESLRFLRRVIDYVARTPRNQLAARSQ